MALRNFFVDDASSGEPRREPRGLLEHVGRHAAIVRAVFEESRDIDNLGRALAAMLLFDKCIIDGETDPLRANYSPLYFGRRTSRTSGTRPAPTPAARGVVLIRYRSVI